MATDITDPDRSTHPALWASHQSWKAVQSHDKAAWLGLMADDVVIEDPIGEAITNPDGQGVRGKEAVEAFYDTNIAVNNLSVDCEETFLSSNGSEVGHVLKLTSRFDGGLVSVVRGIFTYRTNEENLLTNLRGYWHMEAMTFTNEGE
ncbi:nuclear transport factor 2 family protein [Nocardioides sp. R-C-SC26]|uniref:nuclear transport factor 2 family protein n=1 Tax=Nocardioides sp. R-C-SC26 TaxID=2870414 RepID=UPI001E4007FD|nr:nuclear transport factor 2 family protein [Nocardioides sp. R-C-SC26]